MAIVPEYISEDLAPLIIPIENVELLPGNYRHHDLDKLKRSITRWKQRKPITVQYKDADRHGHGIGVCTAGNGTLVAMRELGCTHIAATFFKDTDAEAIAWAVTDNRTHDLGSDDNELLLAALQRIKDDEDLLLTSGYDMADLTALAEKVAPKRQDDNGQGGGGVAERMPGNPVVQYQLIFSSEEDQQLFYKFVRWLKKTQDGETVGDRMVGFIATILEGYAED